MSMHHDFPLLQAAQTAFNKRQYDVAVQYYEQLCELDTPDITHVGYLGLCYLLQEDENSAQLTWSLAVADAEAIDVEEWIIQLSAILDSEADALALNKAPKYLQDVWIIRRHLLDLNPNHLGNLLKFIQLVSENEQYQLEALSRDLDIIAKLTTATLEADQLDSKLILQSLKSLFNHRANHPFTLEITKHIIQTAGKRINCPQLVELLLNHGKYVGQILRYKTVACIFLELGLELEPQNLELLLSLAAFKRATDYYQEAIEYAYRAYRECHTTLEKIKGNAEVIAALMVTGAQWQKSEQLMERQKTFLKELLNEHDRGADPVLGFIILAKSYFHLPYIADIPSTNRPLQNQIAHLIQDSLRAYITKYTVDHQGKQVIFPHIPPIQQSRKLKIGYISRCLYAHSVGWLSRWLFHHHDRERFEIHIYFIQQANISEFSKKWFAQNATYASCFTGDYLGIAEAIYEDGIDILVELDSLTCDCTCSVMALKPAPIQVSWLGLDASGIPAIDYFIVDNHVLPDNAQNYYSEKLWRLPYTYLAVDGFEVGIPTVKRADLDIPEDAIIYLSVQSGFKRHPSFTRIQLEILKQVPNSYLCIKGVGDTSQIKVMFEQLADEAGISFERFRFLDRDPDELTHRANLNIADIVLDTFPYNGATTTMETLWMGIPLVTRVGQQFAARNSYTMLKNAGLSEGIAWNDQEYIEWGIRLGNDANLRSQIRWKLLRSRQTQPLWNAQQFTRQVEKAYRDMWSHYQGNRSIPISSKTLVTPEQTKVGSKPILSIFHNLARAGGTIISKCLGCMENIVLLSEIHPTGPFLARNILSSPTSLSFSCVEQARSWHQLPVEGSLYWPQGKASEDLFTDNFQEKFIEKIIEIYNLVTNQNKKLVIRDWSHLDFIGKPFQVPPNIDMLAQVLAPYFDLHHVYLVRHPIDQWLSMTKIQTLQGISPSQYLDGYLSYLKMAQVSETSHDWFHYESFTSDPEQFLQRLMQKLHLPYDKQWCRKWQSYEYLTGDQAAKTTQARSIRAKIHSNSVRYECQELMDSPTYREILAETGYKAS